MLFSLQEWLYWASQSKLPDLIYLPLISKGKSMKEGNSFLPLSQIPIQLNDKSPGKRSVRRPFFSIIPPLFTLHSVEVLDWNTQTLYGLLCSY